MERNYKLIIVLFAGFCIIAAFSCKPEKYRVLYVNSYHAGYPPSDEVQRAISEHLPAARFDLRICFLDAKRNPSDSSVQKKTDSILDIVSGFDPEIILVSDDNAVMNLIQPHIEIFNCPVVFCGVNWSLSRYQLHRNRITGMLEVLPLRKSLELLRAYYPDLKKIAIVSENSLSEQNNSWLLDTLYRNAGLQPDYYLVSTFGEWKEAMIKAMDSADVVYLPTNGGIREWNRVQAMQFVEKIIRKPIFTCDDFMMDYCVYGLTKVPYEQGEWAAETAKKILAGLQPDLIPIARNRQVRSWLNNTLAGKIGFIPDSTFVFPAP